MYCKKMFLIVNYTSDTGLISQENNPLATSICCNWKRRRQAAAVTCSGGEGHRRRGTSTAAVIGNITEREFGASQNGNYKKTFLNDSKLFWGAILMFPPPFDPPNTVSSYRRVLFLVQLALCLFHVS
jgi:hypothetical protein